VTPSSCVKEVYTSFSRIATSYPASAFSATATMTEWRSFVEMLTDCAESLPLVTRISRGKKLYETSEGGAMPHFSSVAVPLR
jgi:hypothetical protein